MRLTAEKYEIMRLYQEKVSECKKLVKQLSDATNIDLTLNYPENNNRLSLLRVRSDFIHTLNPSPSKSR
jgi:hypothetical protein